MGIASNAGDGARSEVFGRVVQRARSWLLQRRRARAAKRRPGSRRSVWVLVATLVVLLSTFGWGLMYLRPRPVGTRLSIDQLSALATQHRIVSADFLDQDSLVQGAFGAAPATQPTSSGSPLSGSPLTRGTTSAPSGSGSYWVSYPSSDAVTGTLVDMVTAAGSHVSIDSQTSKQTVRLVTTFLLPLMILANLFAVFFLASRGSGSAIGDVISFGTLSKGRYRKGRTRPVTFADVAGADEAVAELKEVRDYLADPKKYEEIGATPPKGVLLFGPPGCGKTLLAKAVAGEAGVPFFSVAGAEFVESLVGVGAARVRDLFQRVRAVAPAIVFIDELDAAGRRRGAGGGGGGSDEREQTLNQLLVEMDGFEVSSGIVVIGATNRPDILDPALLRPGRFDRHITVDQPDHNGRRLILELHAKGKPIASSVDFGYLAKRTPGFSGADLANVINEAALLTVREGKSEIETERLEEAIQRVLTGPKKRGRVLSEGERERAAYHEGGHAIVAAAQGRGEEVHRVSILARGRAIGGATLRRDSDVSVLTRSQLMSEITVALGGLAAEEMVFGETSTGVENDLEIATELARDVVGRFGMGSTRRRLLGSESDAFLGEDLGLGHISPQGHQALEDEIDRLLNEAETRAAELLKEHRSTLDELAARLQSDETLEGDDLHKILLAAAPASSGNGAAPSVTPKRPG